MRRLPVQDPVPRARPLELAGEPRPEPFRILVGVRIQRVVLDVRLRAKRRGRRKRAVLAKKVVDFSALGIGHSGTIQGSRGSRGSRGSWFTGSWGSRRFMVHGFMGFTEVHGSRGSWFARFRVREVHVFARFMGFTRSMQLKGRPPRTL